MRCDFTRVLSLFFIGVNLLFIFSCGNNKKDNLTSSIGNVNNIIIYCENSLVPLLLDLKPEFERRYSCTIQIVNDCSQNLIGLINFSKKGDLFFPDTHSAFDQLRRNTQISITDSVFIGYNRLIIVTPRGNPRNIKGNLNLLVQSNYSLILTNPETSSLGYEVRKALEAKNIYEAILKNVVRLTVDSKGIDKRLLNGEADYSICWQSDVYANGLQISVDTVNIEPEFTYDVYGGVLSCSSNISLAKYFIDFVSSDFGVASARDHGINKRKTQVF